MLRDVAHICPNGKQIHLTRNKDTRLGKAEMEKLLPQMLADQFPDNEVVSQNSGKITAAVTYGTGPDPRLTFGVYSGKHIQSLAIKAHGSSQWYVGHQHWRSPAYRTLPHRPHEKNTVVFDAMLEFAILNKHKGTCCWIGLRGTCKMKGANRLGQSCFIRKPKAQVNRHR